MLLGYTIHSTAHHSLFLLHVFHFLSALLFSSSSRTACLAYYLIPSFPPMLVFVFSTSPSIPGSLSVKTTGKLGKTNARSVDGEPWTRSEQYPVMSSVWSVTVLRFQHKHLTPAGWHLISRLNSCFIFLKKQFFFSLLATVCQSMTKMCRWSPILNPPKNFKESFMAGLTCLQ